LGAVALVLPILGANQHALPPGSGIVEGRVVDSAGKALPGSRVAADIAGGPGGRQRVTVSDERGEFRLGPLPAGTYFVHASNEGADYTDSLFAFLAGPGGTAPKVVVGSGDVVKGVVVRLVTRGATLALRVVDQRTGQALPGATVTLCRKDMAPPACISSATGLAEGRLTLSVPSLTPLSVTVSARAYKTWSHAVGAADVRPRATAGLLAKLTPLAAGAH
jgi:Carboxypeptidase regulatory-like domain